MAEILLYGPIGEDVFAENPLTAQRFVDDLAATDADAPLTVRVNSPGGSVFDGLTIYRHLVERDNVTIRIDGVAASIASIIAMAGERIEIAQSGRLMIHDPMGPSALAFGDSKTLREAAEDTVKTADLLDQIKESLVDVYQARTGVDRGELSDMMAEETWIDAKLAKKMGFADEVLPNKSIAASAVTAVACPVAECDVDKLALLAVECAGIARRAPTPVDTFAADQMACARYNQALTEWASLS